MRKPEAMMCRSDVRPPLDGNARGRENHSFAVRLRTGRYGRLGSLLSLVNVVSEHARGAGGQWAEELLFQEAAIRCSGQPWGESPFAVGDGN